MLNRCFVLVVFERWSRPDNSEGASDTPTLEGNHPARDPSYGNPKEANERVGILRDSRFESSIVAENYQRSWIFLTSDTSLPLRRRFAVEVGGRESIFRG